MWWWFRLFTDSLSASKQRPDPRQPHTTVLRPTHPLPPEVPAKHTPVLVDLPVLADDFIRESQAAVPRVAQVRVVPRHLHTPDACRTSHMQSHSSRRQQDSRTAVSMNGKAIMAFETRQACQRCCQRQGSARLARTCACAGGEHAYGIRVLVGQANAKGSGSGPTSDLHGAHRLLKRLDRLQGQQQV